MGLFSKKATPAPIAKAPTTSAPIAITGLGIACHAGDQPHNLIRSIIAQVSGVRLSEEHKFKQKDGKDALPRMAPVLELLEESERDRMYALAKFAMEMVAANFPTSVKPESTLVVIVVDTELLMRYQKIDTQHMQEFLTDNIPLLSTTTFRILPNDTTTGSTALRTAIAELNEGKWQAIIFGGADSLVSIYTCMDLHNESRLNVVGKREGLVPGEAAAFVLLQSAESVTKNTTPALAYLRGVGVAPEPHARNADIESTEGLSSAINQALTQAGITATDVQGIVHNLGAETVQSLEWHHTTQAVWPRRVSEQQRLAVQNGEIEQADIPDDPIPDIECPYLTMGEVGAAALPMQIATALTWLEYDAHQAKWGFPIRNHLLVCDTPDAPERGALIISTTLA